MEEGCLPDAPLQVAVAVILRDGKVLITQRMPEDSLGGLWEFPGGKLHVGETFEQCLAREIKEELGIEIAVGARLQVIEHRAPHRVIQLHCFSCLLLSGEPQAIECAAWQWVGVDELDRFPFPPATQPMIASLRKTGP